MRQHRHVQGHAEAVRPRAPRANRTCSANQTARFRMTPTTAAVMAASAADQRPVAAQRLDEGRAEEDPQEAGHEGHPGREQPAERRRPAAAAALPGSRKAPMKPTNCTTMISGPGVVSAMPEAVQHLARLQPAIGLDRLLRHVGQHRVGAAEGHHRHLGEEDGDLAEDVRRARASASSASDRPEPQQPGTRRRSSSDQPSGGRACGRQSPRRAPCRRRPALAACLAVAAAGQERRAARRGRRR